MGTKAYPEVPVQGRVGMDGGGRPAQESSPSRGECKESPTSPGLGPLQQVACKGVGWGASLCQAHEGEAGGLGRSTGRCHEEEGG